MVMLVAVMLPWLKILDGEGDVVTFLERGILTRRQLLAQRQVEGAHAHGAMSWSSSSWPG